MTSILPLSTVLRKDVPVRHPRGRQLDGKASIVVALCHSSVKGLAGEATPWVWAWLRLPTGSQAWVQIFELLENGQAPVTVGI